MKPTYFDLTVCDLAVEPRVPIPGIGWYATCAGPGGHEFGAIEADAAAT